MKSTALDYAPDYGGQTGEAMARGLARGLGITDAEALECIRTAGAFERPKVTTFEQLTTARHAVTYYACRLMHFVRDRRPGQLRLPGIAGAA